MNFKKKVTVNIQKYSPRRRAGKDTELSRLEKLQNNLKGSLKLTNTVSKKMKNRESHKKICRFGGLLYSV